MLNLSSDEMEALVEHREKLDAELEQLGWSLRQRLRERKTLSI